MFARSTTITAPAANIDRGVTYVREDLMPIIMNMDGCVGLSLLVDRATGRCITTSAWQDRATMLASAERVRPLRESLISDIGGTAPSVSEWEIGLMHRDHETRAGACARVSWLRGQARAVDNSAEAFRTILPTLEGLPGFCSASVLTDRNHGRVVSTVVYDSAGALVASRAQASQLRTSVADRAGAEVLEVAEFEIALAHLRVPELV